ncbi:MAG: hypothetical protein ACYCX6_09490 [Vulcanimicrobiaceae bacterium]
MLVQMTATTVFLAVAALLVGAAAAWFLREREISALYALHWIRLRRWS